MAKERVREDRYDCRGGRVSAMSPDLLNVNELVDATNARLSAAYGAVTKRTGSQRMHVAALESGAVIRGVTQWDGPSGKQVVVVSNGKLHYSNTASIPLSFTTITPGAGDEFSTTVPAIFTPFRASASGAPLILFIASGGKFYKWSGTVLTRIDTVASTPDADRVIAYHTRLFARDVNFKKHVFWSEIGDGESWATGGKVDGGSALVDVLNGEELIAFEVIGSSLLMAAEDSVMRFTGHSSDDIVIAQDTEGVSPEIGVLGPLCLRRFENLATLLSERGPYVVTETECSPIGIKVEPDFEGYPTTSHLGYHRGRKELWFSDGTSVLVFAPRIQSWFGPFTYPFTSTCLARYESAIGAENLIAGCTDGFVRLLDVGQLDDVLSDGTGGTNITMTVEWPVMHLTRPGITKALDEMALQATLPSGSALQVKTGFDGEALTTDSVISEGSGELNYRVSLNGQGKRLRLQMVDASPKNVTINGFSLWAYDLQRS